MQRGGAFDVRLTCADFRRVNESQPFDAVVFAALLQRRKLGFFVAISCNDQFAAVAERHVVFFAEFVRKAIAFHAKTRLQDRKSTRLNSSHVEISYAVFCLKKKKNKKKKKQITENR